MEVWKERSFESTLALIHRENKSKQKDIYFINNEARYWKLRQSEMQMLCLQARAWNELIDVERVEEFLKSLSYAYSVR